MPASAEIILGVPITPMLQLQDVQGLVVHSLQRDSKLLITFVNPWIVSKPLCLDGSGETLFDDFDLVCCDGIGMVWAARLLIGQRAPQRISFDETSLAIPFFEACKSFGKQVVLVGGEHGVALRAALAISNKVPSLSIAGVFNGFQEVPLAIEFLRANTKVVVVCGMGLPYQEKFLQEALRAGWSGVGVTCGGYLDQVSSGGSYYPSYINRFNLRAFYRLYKEPRRLWRRYSVEYLPFVLALIGEFLWRRR